MVDLARIIKENYEKNLKAEEYLSEMEDVWKKIPDILHFMMEFIYDVVCSGRFKGSKLLEIGSGATVHSIASASAYFPNIVLSDYVEDNVDHLKRWIAGESNLKQFLQVPAEVEGYGKDLDAGIKILESRIRKNVKRVTRCDVLSDGILIGKSDSSDTEPPFDLIISSLCLQAAPKDLQSFANILKRINALLRQGGGLIVIDFFKAGMWKVGEKQFNYISVSREELMDCLQEAGFGNIQLKTVKKEERHDYYYEFDELYCFSAEKCEVDN